MLYRKFGKRLFDIVFSLLFLLLLSPFLLLVALLVKLTSPGPVLFVQERLGINTTVFSMYKFRSMYVGSESKGTGTYSYKDDPRVTRLGRVLRKFSIDELPQLFNILKGDMSFVGMRPPLTYHPCKVEEYTKEQLKAFSLRPGITGWAQIHGRNAVYWDERIQLSLWYRDNLSFMLDMKIIAQTLGIVLKRKDVIAQAETAAGFNGKPDPADAAKEVEQIAH